MIIIKDFKINPEYIENHPLSSKKNSTSKSAVLYLKNQWFVFLILVFSCRFLFLFTEEKFSDNRNCGNQNNDDDNHF